MATRFIVLMRLVGSPSYTALDDECGVGTDGRAQLLQVELIS